MIRLLPDLLRHAATQWPEAEGLVQGTQRLSHGQAWQQAQGLAAWLAAQGVGRGERVAIWLDKSLPAVLASVAAAECGAVFVPVNPVLKPAQVLHLLQDSGAKALVCTEARWALLREQGGLPNALPNSLQLLLGVDPLADTGALRCGLWAEALSTPPRARPAGVCDSDLAAILYTSGSTGAPKGVMLSHRNLVAGAESVAEYLGNHAGDRLLAALPLSFDAGFSQLTTAWRSGACAVLHTPLLPRDLLKILAAERITGLTAVPPLYIQLAQLPDSAWPELPALRYFANTGGRMPLEILQRLRHQLPAARPFLMYGLTEAFRSSYLDPAEIERRPDSIGKAIPNAELLVLRDDGSPCAPEEPGELVHRGPLVAQGYWNDPARTAERFRPLPPQALPERPTGLVREEIAVFSGDTVRRDADGFLYFVARRDEMIKTSGYRVSPSEVEEAVYATGLVGECAAFGLPHAQLGQQVALVFTAPEGGQPPSVEQLQAALRPRLPAYMLPLQWRLLPAPLPRNGNGKIDRRLLAQQLD